MKQGIKGATALALVMALSACGGGDGASGGGVISTPAPGPAPAPAPTPAPSPTPAPAPTPSPSPTPAPTPTPSPTPTPTPTPAPTASYTKIAAMQGNRTFQTAGVRSNISLSGNSSSTSNALGSGVRVEYTASSQTYRLTAPDGATSTFTPGDLDRANSILPRLSAYENNNDDVFVIASPDVNGVELSYTVIGSWIREGTNNSAIVHSLVAGAPTLASDMPRSGSATYSTAISGSVIQGGAAFGLTSSSSATFTADFGQNRVQTSLSMTGQNLSTGTFQSFGSYSGTGTINGAAFIGNLQGSGVRTGLFSGAFFGPAATEMGLAWAINHASFDATGTVVGIKR